MSVWTQEQALQLCRKIEDICPEYGCHVALTGGLLYKDGPRKDADILFYRIRQIPEIDQAGFYLALGKIGVQVGNDYGWCVKAEYEGKPVDMFFPENSGEDYPESDDAFVDPDMLPGGHDNPREEIF